MEPYNARLGISSATYSLGALSYQGVWNADTNTPTIVSGTGVAGQYYVVDVAGSTNIDGMSDWDVGDWIIFNGTAWQKIDNSDQVTSVNGMQGAVIVGLPSVLGQDNSTGAFDISINSGQSIQYNEGFGGSLNSLATTSVKNWSLPDASGTIALTSDIPSTQSLQEVMDVGSVGSVPNTISIGTSIGNQSGIYATQNFGGNITSQIRAIDTSTFESGFFSVILGTGINMAYFNGSGIQRMLFVGESGMLVADGVNSIGLEYGSDYSANYTPRSLVDKEYVDNLVSGSNPLSEILVNGNTTGGNDIDVSNGDSIVFSGGESTLSGSLIPATVTANRVWTLPDASGTLALLSDVNTWTTPNIGLSAGWLSVGGSDLLSGSAGYYRDFDPLDDDGIVNSITLKNDGIDYDGSDLQFKVFYQLFGVTPVVDDTIRLEIEVVLLSENDDANAIAKTTITTEIDVRGRVASNMYLDDLIGNLTGNNQTLSGVSGAKTLQITFTRVGTLDTYDGHMELYGLELTRVGVGTLDTYDGKMELY